MRGVDLNLSKSSDRISGRREWVSAEGKPQCGFPRSGGAKAGGFQAKPVWRRKRHATRVGLSSPTPAAKKDSIVDTISAMEFCFIYGKYLIFALLPLISVVSRAFFHIKTINPPTSAPARQKRRILYRSSSQSLKE